MDVISHSGTNPPLPSEGGKSSSAGQNLLALLRSFEKNPADLDTLEQVVEAMQRLISSTHRRGLLEGNELVAEKVLAASSSSNSSAKQQLGSASKKKRRGGGRRGGGGRSFGGLNSNDDLVIHTDPTAENNNKGSGPTLDGQLIVLAILRILAPEKSTQDQESSTPQVTDDRILLRALAADLCTSICGSILARSTADTCTVAEYELMASSGKQLLGNLELSAQKILQLIPIADGGLRVASLDQEEHVYALKACLRACSALVCLFGTKLSRSAKVLAGLCSLGWGCLVVTADGVVPLAAKLLAALPMAGGTDNTTPSDLWNRSLREAVSVACHAIHIVAPINSLSDSLLDNGQVPGDAARSAMEQHIDKIRASSCARARGESLLHLIHGVVALATSLLNCDAFGANGSGQLIQAQIDCESILGLVETMLSYPLASEATFHGTKKRLRSEPVDGGLISAAVLAGKVANQVKLYGYELLESLVGAVGGAALLPHARRIQRISHAALLTSSSAAVRRAVDPASEMHFSGKRQRWLHSSVTVRTAAVRSFKISVLAFGCDPDSNTSTSSGYSSASGTISHGNVMEKSVNLVCGCLLEELVLKSTPQQQSDEWGSLNERAQLVVESAECLAACLTSSGEYMSQLLRSLLDSVASICLGSIRNWNHASNGLCTFTSVRVALVQFAAACAGTPWQDGAASSIVSCELVQTARFLCQNDDAAVVEASNSAIRLCEALACRRAPALVIVTERKEGPGALAMLKQMETAQSDMDDRRKKEQEEKVDPEVQVTSTGKHNRDPVIVSATESKKPKVTLDEKKDENERVVPAANTNTPRKPPPGETALPAEPSTEKKEPTISTEPNKEQVEATTQKQVSFEPPVQDNDESDDDFPPIVDCGPDEGDE